MYPGRHVGHGNGLHAIGGGVEIGAQPHVEHGALGGSRYVVAVYPGRHVGQGRGGQVAVHMHEAH